MALEVLFYINVIFCTLLLSLLMLGLGNYFLFQTLLGTILTVLCGGTVAFDMETMIVEMGLTERDLKRSVGQRSCDSLSAEVTQV